MSRAFTRESDGEWFHDVPPTLSALIHYLTKENNGIRVIEERCYVDDEGREIHAMSNGLSYYKDVDAVWRVADE